MGPRSSIDDDLAYGERWDKDRFLFEREREERERHLNSRGPPVRTRESSPDGPARRPVSSRRPWEDDDHYRPRERRYVDEDRPIRRSPPLRVERDFERLVIDAERERPRDYSPPRRPGMLLRRQSSLDTFDRRPAPRFYEKDQYDPPARRPEYRPEPYEPIPLPRHKRLPPPRVYAERDYEEIKISEPDRYGDEEYHAYPERLLEREIVKSKRRRSGSRTSKSRTRRSASRTSTTSSSSSSSSSSSAGGTTITGKSKSQYPKKGKTRIPARLVNTRALIDLTYPFIQEGNTVIVQMALGQENIDEVLRLSDEYNKAEAEVAGARSSHHVEERREEIFTIPPPPIVTTPAPPPPPPMAPAAPGPPPQYPVAHSPTLIREVSPARTTRSRRSHSTSTTAASRRGPVVIDAHHPTWETSNEVAVGPLALVNDRHRSDRDINMEIAQLEAERDLLRVDRHHHYHHSHRSHSVSPGRELVKAERLPTGELVIYEQEVEKVVEPRRGVRIEKDKKGRMSISVPKYRT